MLVLKTHPVNPPLRHIRKAIEALEAGDLIAYATDTIYGLGCRGAILSWRETHRSLCL